MAEEIRGLPASRAPSGRADTEVKSIAEDFATAAGGSGGGNAGGESPVVSLPNLPASRASSPVSPVHRPTGPPASLLHSAHAPGDHSPGIAALRVVCDAIHHISLYVTHTTLYLVGSNATRTRHRLLRISRSTSMALPVAEEPSWFTSEELTAKMKDLHRRHSNFAFVTFAHGVVGILKLLSGHYLVLITGCESAGIIAGHRVYSISKTSIFPISNGARPTGDEEKYIALFKGVDMTKQFYFSYTFDLSNSMQKNVEPLTSHPVMRDTQEMFVWNTYLLQHLLRHVGGGAHEVITHAHWILPVIYGYFQQSDFIARDGTSIHLTLLSRRSRHFAGARYLRRGVNEDGNVANEVETETLIWVPDNQGGGRMCSSVQVRGSIPLIWTHGNVMRPKPDIIVDTSDTQFVFTKRHFNGLVERYGLPIVALSLIRMNEHTPKEGLLGQRYYQAVKHLNASSDWLDVWGQRSWTHVPLVYHTFDYLHHAKLSTATAVQADLMKIISTVDCGLFCATIDGTGHAVVHSRQEGVLRTNCVDCLDRTNVAQSCLAHCILPTMLAAAGVPAPDVTSRELWPMLAAMFQAHGDAMAMQYAGSAAMHKADTVAGTGPKPSTDTPIPVPNERLAALLSGKVVNNAVTGITRYANIFFNDSKKQMSLDLFLGQFVPYQGQEPLWQQTPSCSLTTAVTATKVAGQEAVLRARRADRRLRGWATGAANMSINFSESTSAVPKDLGEDSTAESKDAAGAASPALQPGTPGAAMPASPSTAVITPPTSPSAAWAGMETLPLASRMHALPVHEEDDANDSDVVDVQGFPEGAEVPVRLLVSVPTAPIQLTLYFDARWDAGKLSSFESMPRNVQSGLDTPTIAPVAPPPAPPRSRGPSLSDSDSSGGSVVDDTEALAVTGDWNWDSESQRHIFTEFLTYMSGVAPAMVPSTDTPDERPGWTSYVRARNAFDAVTAYGAPSTLLQDMVAFTDWTTAETTAGLEFFGSDLSDFAGVQPDEPETAASPSADTILDSLQDGPAPVPAAISADDTIGLPPLSLLGVGQPLPRTWSWHSAHSHDGTGAGQPAPSSAAASPAPAAVAAVPAAAGADSLADVAPVPVGTPDLEDDDSTDEDDVVGASAYVTAPASPVLAPVGQRVAHLRHEELLSGPRTPDHPTNLFQSGRRHAWNAIGKLFK